MRGFASCFFLMSRPPIQTFYLDTKLRILDFLTPSLSLLGTWSLVNDISTRVFNAQIDPGAHPWLQPVYSRPTLPCTRGAAPREKLPAGQSGTLLSSLGFLTQRTPPSSPPGTF